jgi:acyl-homoserine lactone synthase
MIVVAQAVREPQQSGLIKQMFEARKRVFVDLLKWDIPVLAGQFEVDEFDTPEALYLIVTDETGAHLGSARLLATERAHILDSLFPQLCAGQIPRGPQIQEITRFCLDPRANGKVRRDVRNRLVAALVDHALVEGIQAYTGVAELNWLQQILAFGWQCRPLGLPRTIGGKMLGALQIDVTAETPALLAANGIYSPQRLAPAVFAEAA